MALVALPVILGTLVPSRPLGADAAQGNFNLSVASTYAGSALPSNTADWNILDWIQAFYSDDDSVRLDGREANVIGFVVRDENFPPGYFMVARFFVSCCVADGTSVGLPVVWEGTGSLREDTWVRVRGNIEVGEFLGDTLPILYATTVDHTVGQPDRPYLYP
jgi:uncharacterized repeat protein (TIGR03943 family)